MKNRSWRCWNYGFSFLYVECVWLRAGLRALPESYQADGVRLYPYGSLSQYTRAKPPSPRTITRSLTGQHGTPALWVFIPQTIKRTWLAQHQTGGVLVVGAARGMSKVKRTIHNNIRFYWTDCHRTLLQHNFVNFTIHPISELFRRPNLYIWNLKQEIVNMKGQGHIYK